jgi:hypothetical protein
MVRGKAGRSSKIGKSVDALMINPAFGEFSRFERNARKTSS